jgi:DNA-binding SARP family transcriptional activator/streptogramin lyase
MEFRILGPLEVDDGGRNVPLGGSKQRALLALLLLHANRVVPRDRLIDELWETAPPETARTALQVHVSQLRKALGREAIVTRAPGYVIQVGPEQLDLERFERLVATANGSDASQAAGTLREALALWRGPPLADIGDSVARPQRAQLEEQRLLALEQRIDADLDLRLQARLVPELEALVREHPLRERFRGQLMLALYRCGRQAEALDAYQRGRRLLSDDLGLEPGDQLKQLEKAILEQDPSLAVPEASLGAPAAAPVAREGPRRLRPILAIAVGALLLAGALAAGLVLATRGSEPIAVRANSVAKLDARSGKVVADVPIGGRPIAIAFGAGSIWVVDADHSTISRIDAKTNEALPIGGLGTDLSDVAFGFGSLWVAGGNDGTLIRIDPRHNSPTEVTLGKEGKVVPSPVFAVRTGAGAVWVTRGNELLRVDPREERVTDQLRVSRPQGLAVGPDAVWLTTEDERVLRVDPGTVQVAFGHDVSSPTYFPVVDRDSLWVIAPPGPTDEAPHLWRLDAETLDQNASIAFPNGAPYALTAGDGALWLVDSSSGAVWRIDPQTSSVKRFARVAHHPVAVGADKGVVWIGVQGEPIS